MQTLPRRSTRLPNLPLFFVSPKTPKTAAARRPLFGFLFSSFLSSSLLFSSLGQQCVASHGDKLATVNWLRNLPLPLLLQLLPSVNVPLLQSGTGSHQQGQISDQGENPDHGESARSEIRRGTHHQKQHDRQGGRHAEGNQNAQRPVHEGSPAEWTLRRSHKKSGHRQVRGHS